MSAATILLLISAAMLALWLWGYTAKRRMTRIQEKYPDAELAQKIIHNQIWQGQTGEQLIDSIGRPSAIDEKILKSKTRHVYKYQSEGKGKYKLRVTLEDGIVVGWEKR